MTQAPCKACPHRTKRCLLPQRIHNMYIKPRHTEEELDGEQHLRSQTTLVLSTSASYQKPQTGEIQKSLPYVGLAGSNDAICTRSSQFTPLLKSLPCQCSEALSFLWGKLGSCCTSYSTLNTQGIFFL